ncbi:MAG TPA: DUF4142 domain-containing protein [Phnomibacter sp.]|nr:DUF4142 domain-containing protein [Phnomibacter sp.]
MILTTLLTGFILFTSCGQNQALKENNDTTEVRNDVVYDNDLQDTDARFLINAAEVNLEEIELAKLAQQKGTANHVKELGRMMEAEHTRSFNEVKALAKSKSITIPNATTGSDRNAYQDLNERSGNDFDKTYTDMMVEKHRDVIAAFEKVSNDAGDAEIKDWATRSLTTLRTHLDHSIDSQKKSQKI